MRFGTKIAYAIMIEKPKKSCLYGFDSEISDLKVVKNRVVFGPCRINLKKVIFSSISDNITKF